MKNRICYCWTTNLFILPPSDFTVYIRSIYFTLTCVYVYYYILGGNQLNYWYIWGGGSWSNYTQITFYPWHNLNLKH